MLFNSFAFFLFLAAFALCYFLCPRRFRYVVIVSGSYFFYMQWRVEYAFLLLAITTTDFLAALAVSRSESKKARGILLSSALLFDFGLLVYFKYAAFLLESFQRTTGFLGNAFSISSWTSWSAEPLDILLPVGISFFIFQSTGYLIDVYCRRRDAETNFILYSSFVTFFPQLVAGPIERANNLLPQIRDGVSPTKEQVASGGWLILHGLFKKMCVADLIAPVVNAVFQQPENFHGSYLALAIVLFAIQIYCDFSGYTDIARGVGRLFGYELMLNFRQPYFSQSVGEFWQRWHISLSTWFRDYLYFPLGGNRVSKLKWSRNILIVFAVSGIWHGAAWTFVIWGLIHGIAIILERFFQFCSVGFFDKNPESKVRVLVGWSWTMAIVLSGWVFFRAESFSDIAVIFRGLISPGGMNYATFKTMGLPSFEILIACFHLVALFAIDYIINNKERFQAVSQYTQKWRPVIAALAIYDILLFGVFESIDFIYFQF